MQISALNFYYVNQDRYDHFEVGKKHQNNDL